MMGLIDLAYVDLIVLTICSRKPTLPKQTRDRRIYKDVKEEYAEIGLS